MTKYNYLPRKVAGATWGADVNVLRASTLVLVYSVAEYGASLWLESVHTKRIDVTLNKALRVITGAVSSTPKECKAFLSKQELLADRLPKHNDLNNLQRQRVEKHVASS